MRKSKESQALPQRIKTYWAPCVNYNENKKRSQMIEKLKIKYIINYLNMLGI